MKREEGMTRQEKIDLTDLNKLHKTRNGREEINFELSSLLQVESTTEKMSRVLPGAIFKIVLLRMDLRCFVFFFVRPSLALSSILEAARLTSIFSRYRRFIHRNCCLTEAAESSR